MRRALLLQPFIALLLTACWVSSETGEVPTPAVSFETPTPTGKAGAPLYSDTLIGPTMDADVVVVGYVVVDASGARLCGALAESLPPQCAGPGSTRVIGIERLDARYNEAQGVRWTETPVTLWGHYAGGTLTLLEGDPPSDVVVPSEKNVDGTLWIKGDDVRLCSVMAASIPPLCSEPYIRVIGLPDDQRLQLEEAEGVQWSSGPRSLRGQLMNGVLVVSS